MAKWETERFEGYLQQLQVGEMSESVREVLEKLLVQFYALYDDYIVEDGEARAAKQPEFERALAVFFQLGHALTLQLVIHGPIDGAELISSRPGNQSNTGATNADGTVVDGSQSIDTEQLPAENQVDALANEMPKLVPISQRRNFEASGQPEPSASTSNEQNVSEPYVKPAEGAWADEMRDVEAQRKSNDANAQVSMEIDKRAAETEIPYEQMVFILKPILALPTFDAVTEPLIQEPNGSHSPSRVHPLKIRLRMAI